jgi:hypothetical protein
MTVKRKKEIEMFINRQKKDTPTVAEMLAWYKSEGNSYAKNPMWRIGYLCAMRDEGRISWGDWSTLVSIERLHLPHD